MADSTGKSKSLASCRASFASFLEGSDGNVFPEDRLSRFSYFSYFFFFDHILDLERGVKSDRSFGHFGDLMNFIFSF